MSLTSDPTAVALCGLLGVQVGKVPEGGIVLVQSAAGSPHLLALPGDGSYNVLCLQVQGCSRGGSPASQGRG